MKKILLGFIPLLILIASCVATPTTSTRATGVDELDTTIREASDELNIDVPAGNYIGIINIQSSSAALSEYIIDELIRNAVRDRNFTVVDRQRLDQIRQEHDFQYSGEVDDNLAVDIGRIIGLQTIVTGSVSPLGSRYRITIRALNVQTGAVQAQFNKNIGTGETIVALMAMGGSVTQTASAGNAGQASTSTTSGGTTQAAAPSQTQTTAQTTAPSQTQTPAQAVAIANGTYTFWPRPRAHVAGVDVDTYLDRIVVRGGYLTIYLTGSDKGGFQILSGYGNRWMTYRAIIQCLDNPRLSWQPVNSSNDLREHFLSFQGVTTKRFSLTNPVDPPVIFDEINLDDAHYEP